MLALARAAMMKMLKMKLEVLIMIFSMAIPTNELG
jgi:hypothetical protein